MAIVRWEPFRDLVAVQDRLNRIFDDTFRGNPRGSDEDWALGGQWAPSVDIFEHEGNLVLRAELPGIEPKDVDVHVENNVLTLRGERKFEDEKNGRNYHRVERSYGQFVRSFTLPNDVDRDNVKATFTNGLLEVAIPKREEAKPRQIQISAGSEPKTVDVKAR